MHNSNHSRVAAWETYTIASPVNSTHPLAAHLPLYLWGQLIKQVLALCKRGQVLSWHLLQTVQHGHWNATLLTQLGSHKSPCQSAQRQVACVSHTRSFVSDRTGHGTWGTCQAGSLKAAGCKAGLSSVQLKAGVGTIFGKIVPEPFLLAFVKTR